MGMYTEFNIGISFKKNTPDNIIKILEYLLCEGRVEYGREEYLLRSIKEESELAEHELFKCDRWEIVLVGDSAYFDGITDSKMEFDEISEKYRLNVRSNIKNYCQEIEKFMDFISAYIYTEGFLGYMRHEECDDPTLIYNNRGTIIYRNI